MSADKFMATLLSENSNEPIVQDVHDHCSEKESSATILTFQGLVTVPKTEENEAIQTSNNDWNIDKLNLTVKNDSSDDLTNDTEILMDDIVDSISTRNGIEEKSNKVDGTQGNIINDIIIKTETEISLTKLPESSCNENLLSKSKVPLEVEGPATQNYREESGSSDDDTSSSFSLGSSSDCSDSFLDKMHKNVTPSKVVNIKTKGELDLDDLPPIEDLTITVKESEMQKIGTIYAIVDKLVIVRALKDLQPLDLDSVLFLSYENPLGRIFDVFGPVVEPFYSVRFNSKQHIVDKCIVNDADVFFAPDKTDITSYVFVDQLRKQKGSDASWQDNNEPPEEYLDYSDDEEEKRAKWKRRAKNRTRSLEDDDVQIIPNKASYNARGTQEPWSPRDNLLIKSSPSQQYRTKPASNPFYTPFSHQHSSSQNGSIPSLSRPTMAAVMTSKYTPPSSRNDTSQVTSNAPQRFAQQQNYAPTRQSAYPPCPAFRLRPSVVVVPQTTVAQAPFIFEARRVPLDQMPPQPPHRPMQSFSPRPQQQPYMVQPPASPAPAFQQHPVFGQGPSFHQGLMSPAPIQNQFMNGQVICYPPYRPVNLVSQSPNFVRQAHAARMRCVDDPNFGSQARNLTSPAPNFVGQAHAARMRCVDAPNFGSQARNLASPAPTLTSQAPNPVSQAPTFTNSTKFMYHTPNFSNQAPNFVNPGVPILVDTPMGPQFQQVHSMTPPPSMRIAPLTVNIPSSPSPQAGPPYIQQSPGLLNVLPPNSQNFTQNRYR